MVSSVQWNLAIQIWWSSLCRYLETTPKFLLWFDLSWMTRTKSRSCVLSFQSNCNDLAQNSSNNHYRQPLIWFWSFDAI
jgi:hypothetical protein